MYFDNIYAEFQKGKSDEYYTQLAEKEVLAVPMLVQILIDNSGKSSRWAERVLEKVSSENPYIVYPYFEYIARIFDEPDRAESWSAWKIISNILCADSRNLWDNVKDKYFTALHSTLITEYLSALSAAEKIIKAKPESKEKIFSAVSSVGTREFKICKEPSPQSNIIAIEATENFLKVYK